MYNQYLLDKWNKKYIKSSASIVKYRGESNLDMDDGYRMGYIMTHFHVETVESDIWINRAKRDCPEFFTNCILWHEFCHHWDAWNERHVDHCLKFQQLKMKKPMYAIGDFLLKFMGWIWFD